MMGEELKVSAYALSSTGKELNLDNMYVNGRFVNVGSDTKSVINKVSHADFQIYGVCDSEIGVQDDRQMGTANGNAVMQMMQRLQTTLTDVGKIEKDRIWDALVDTNRNLKNKKNDLGLDVMGSSFTGLFLHGNRGLAVHLGDSRIYVVRGGRMLQITDDHLESSDMYRLGVISQAQAEIHKRSSNLTAYMGMDDIYDAKDEAFSKYFVFYPGDTFILCTDGVSDALPNQEMERMVRLLKDATVDTLANMMMKAAADHSDDDMTIMILRVEDAPGETPKRGTSTIPRRENFEKQSMPENNEEKRGSAILSKIPKAIRKTEPEEEDTRETFVEEREPAPRRMQNLSSISDDPDLSEEYDDEGSLLDRLLSNPKQLAMMAGGAVVVIILLIVIIMAFSGDDTASNSSLPSQSSVVLNSSTPQDDSFNNSSLSTNDSSNTSSINDSENSSDANNSSNNSSSMQEYTVVDGDYFYSIVLEYYDIGDLEFMEAFAAYNNMTLESDLQPGMVLKIPPKEVLLKNDSEAN